MVALVVEDGSFISGANSYVSLANAQAYWTTWGYTAQGSDSTTQTNALYYAAYAMDRLYGRFYAGKVMKHSPQAMLWPRQRAAQDGPRIFVSDPTGSGAQIVVRVLDGFLTAAYVVQGGNNYSSTPTINVVDSSGLNGALTATVTSGIITSVAVSNAGMNYCTPQEFRDNNGVEVAINEVPQGIIDAQCELALMAIQDGTAALFPNEAEDRIVQQEINELGAGLNLRRQYFPAQNMDVERYEGFRSIELRLWSVLNRSIVVL